MKRSRLGPGQLLESYRWYDRGSGAIDLVTLALDAMTGSRARPRLDAPPPWIRGLALPTRLPRATLPELAHLSGVACRAWVDAGRPGLDAREDDPKEERPGLDRGARHAGAGTKRLKPA